MKLWPLDWRESIRDVPEPDVVELRARYLRDIAAALRAGEYVLPNLKPKKS